MSLRYHIARDGQRRGPLTETEFREEAATGNLRSTHLGWHEGMPAWQNASTLLPELAAAPQSPSLPPAPPSPAVQAAHTESSAKGTTGLVLGIVNLVSWLIPLFGLPLAVWGLVASLKARGKGAGGAAVAGIVLNILALVLVIGNAAIGAYLGATGQHPWLK